MRSRSLGVVSPVILIVICASLVWPLREAKGQKPSRKPSTKPTDPGITGSKVLCFVNKEPLDNRNCQKMKPMPPAISVSLEECCAGNTKGNMFYFNITQLNRILQFLLSKNCTPCPIPPPPVNLCDNKDVCPAGTLCKMKTSTRVKCVVPKPVCGTDGKTYITEHELRKKAVHYPDIEVAYDGKCQTGCDNVVCRKNGTCVIDQYNRAFCVKYCNVRCSEILKRIGPLCGADGAQYANLCSLRKETCKRGKTIGMAYKGACIANATCDTINCGKKVCVEDDDGRPRCITCSCGATSSYVTELECKGNYENLSFCGSDGQTYRNYSSLRKKICTTKSFIKVAHLGPCPGHPQQQSTSPEEVPSSKKHPAPKLSSEDVAKYYITLKHFVNIIKREYGLNITTPKYKRMKPWEKVVLMTELIKAFKKNWRKKVCQIKSSTKDQHLGPCPGDLPKPIASPQDVTSSENDPFPKLYSEDIAKYYITLKHFVNILKRDYGLNITSPKYKRLNPKEKVVLMSDLIEALKEKWRKIKNWP